MAKAFPKEVASSWLALVPASLQQSEPDEAFVLDWRDGHCSMGNLCLAGLRVCLCEPVCVDYFLSFHRGLCWEALTMTKGSSNSYSALLWWEPKGRVISK